VLAYLTLAAERNQARFRKAVTEHRNASLELMSKPSQGEI
jgi:hypothetical protein